MAIGSGLAAQLGLAAESTYGTAVAPTRFHEALSFGLSQNKMTAQGAGLAAGRGFMLGAHRAVTTRSAEGNIELEVMTSRFGLIWQTLFGQLVTPVQQGATTAYKQVNTWGDNIGRSLTIQAGVPDLTGTVRPYTFTGCKFSQAEFSCDVDGLLMAKLDVDSQQVTEATGLGAASYPTTTKPFHFAQMSLKVGTFGAEAAVGGVKKVSVSVNRPHATDRFYAAGSGFKAEPIWNDWAEISGSIQQDFVNKADFADRFRDDTPTSLVWEFVSTDLAGVGNPFSWRLILPSVYLDTGTPQVESSGLVSTSHDFTYRFDGTNLPRLEYVSTDVAV